MTNPRIIVLLLCIGLFIRQTVAQTIPFQLAGKLIIVQATVDGQAGNFIMDTGIPNLVLNSRYFSGEPTNKSFHGVNGQTGILAVSNPSVRIGDSHFWEKIYAEVIPMLQLERSKGIPLHGLLGTKLFQNFTLLIDYQKLEIELYPLDKKGENSVFSHQTPQPIEIMPFKLKGGTPLVSFQIGNKELKLALDTGAEVNLLADKYLEKLSFYLGAQQQQDLCGFGRKTQKVTLAKVSGLRAGTITSQEMRTVFSDLSDYNRCVIGPMADGIIGYEFLNQFRVAFNFKKREMYLWQQLDGLLVEN